MGMACLGKSKDYGGRKVYGAFGDIEVVWMTLQRHRTWKDGRIWNHGLLKLILISLRFVNFVTCG